MQGPGFDQIEIRDQRAELGEVFDPADQVLDRGVIFVDDRCATALAVVHQKIHPVAPEAVGVPRRHDGVFDRLRPRARRELIGGLDQIALHRVEMLQDRRQIRVRASKLLDEVAHRRAGDVLAKLAQLRARLAFPLRHLPKDRLEAALELLDLGPDPLLLLGRQAPKLLRGHHLVVAHRRQDHPDRRPQQGDVTGLRRLLQLGEGIVLPLLRGLFDRLSSDPDIFALESGRNRRAKLIDQLADRPPELPAPTRRQRERLRPVGLGEVVHVAPVRGHRLGGGLSFEHLTYDGMLADARRPEREQMIVLVADTDAEAQSRERALLADDGIQRLKLRRARKLELSRIATAIESIGGDRFDLRHRFLPTPYASRPSLAESHLARQVEII